jgi:hypothetical protein
MAEMGLWTSGETALIIKSEDAEKAAIVERLKMFVVDGLIEQEGDLNPGRGHVRMYSDGVVCFAAVLNTLTDFGIQVRRGPYANFWLFVRGEVEQARIVWLQAKKRGVALPTLHLELADAGKVDEFGRRFFAYLHGMPRRVAHPGALIAPIAWSSHTVALSRLFKQIDARMAAFAKEKAG